MKITGPGQPPAPETPGSDAPAGPGRAEKAGRPTSAGDAERPEGAERASTFAAKLSPAVPPHAAAGTLGVSARPGLEGVRGATSSNAVPTTDIAADLRSHRLTPRASVEKIIERVVDRQVGPDAPAAVRESVRTALEDALENDPLLAEKLRQLA